MREHIVIDGCLISLISTMIDVSRTSDRCTEPRCILLKAYGIVNRMMIFADVYRSTDVSMYTYGCERTLLHMVQILLRTG